MRHYKCIKYIYIRMLLSYFIAFLSTLCLAHTSRSHVYICPLSRSHAYICSLSRSHVYNCSLSRLHARCPTRTHYLAFAVLFPPSLGRPLSHSYTFALLERPIWRGNVGMRSTGYISRLGRHTTTRSRPAILSNAPTRSPETEVSLGLASSPDQGVSRFSRVSPASGPGRGVSRLNRVSPVTCY